MVAAELRPRPDEAFHESPQLKRSNQAAKVSPNRPIHVLYEASCFGGTAGGNVVRTGVFRVVEAVAQALVASTRCDLRFCLLANFDSAPSVEEHLASVGLLAHHPFCLTPAVRSLGATELAVRRAAQAQPKLRWRDRLSLEWLRHRRRRICLAALPSQRKNGTGPMCCTSPSTSANPDGGPTRSW